MFTYMESEEGCEGGAGDTLFIFPLFDMLRFGFRLLLCVLNRDILSLVCLQDGAYVLRFVYGDGWNVLVS